MFSRQIGLSNVGYVDAYYAKNLGDRRSTASYISILAEAAKEGSFVSYRFGQGISPMATSKILAPLCLMVLVFGLCLSMVKSQSYGVCEGFDPEAPRCAVRCSVPDYVCGTDGVTYTCGCKDAFCNGVDVVKKGKC
ncbi:hypothetical protein NC653_033080 [Populus alba x Populus x berolinensis]|uniref:Uncharacterized protein n=1 Tax=Populus alba x Populus x berolinensis TaxID=444605 RepID=A0AAD6PYW0_9ROSI|nr:hypothetical protein NC653_033080 [Populus alba x Populus x berolinensis]